MSTSQSERILKLRERIEKLEALAADMSTTQGEAAASRRQAEELRRELTALESPAREELPSNHTAGSAGSGVGWILGSTALVILVVIAVQSDKKKEPTGDEHSTNWEDYAPDEPIKPEPKNVAEYGEANGIKDAIALRIACLEKVETWSRRQLSSSKPLIRDIVRQYGSRSDDDEWGAIYAGARFRTEERLGRESEVGTYRVVIAYLGVRAPLLAKGEFSLKDATGDRIGAGSFTISELVPDHLKTYYWEPRDLPSHMTRAINGRIEELKIRTAYHEAK